jgi:hypothetical protein
LIGGEARHDLGNLFVAAAHADVVTEDMVAREHQKAFRAPLIIVVAAVCNSSSLIPVSEQLLSAGAAAEHIMPQPSPMALEQCGEQYQPAYDPAIKLAFGLEIKSSTVGFLDLGNGGSAPVLSSSPILADINQALARHASGGQIK